MCDSSPYAPGAQKFLAMNDGKDRGIPAGMSQEEYLRLVKIASQDPSVRQFQWQKEQAAKAEADALARRQAMEQGLGKINESFGKFDDAYYKGIADKYSAYATPQIEREQAAATFNTRSSLANRGKLGSSTDARMQGDLATTFGSIFRDAAAKGEDYANQQRGSVNAAKQAAIGQMYASESQDAGLQAAQGAVQSLSAGPTYEPVTALLAQAAKFATMDANNSLYNGSSYGLFSPITNRMPGAGGGQVKTIT